MWTIRVLRESHTHGATVGRAITRVFLVHMVSGDLDLAFLELATSGISLECEIPSL